MNVTSSALVTGGAGFIGSHLVDALVARGVTVRVLDDFSTGRRQNLAAVLDRCEVLEGDLRDPASCAAACQGVDAVFHQAALGSVPRSIEDPVTTCEVNVMGTAHLLAAAVAQNVDAFVYASSSSVYGDHQERVRSEGLEGAPLSPYAASKRAAEEIARSFTQSFGIRTIGLRYFNVYGARQDPNGPYAAVVPRFATKLLAGKPPTIFGDGEQSRDFTHVSDVVEANLLAAEADVAEGTFNVGRGASVTVNELAQRIGTAVGRELGPVYADARPGDVLHSQADAERAARELGFRARVDLDEGLERSLQYYRSLAEGSRDD